MFFFKKKVKNDFPSELRMDIVSKDWVVIAKGRAKKPGDFTRKAERQEVSSESCPFCNIQTQEKPTAVFCNGKEIKGATDFPAHWTAVSFPNKYPAFIREGELNDRFEGPLYKVMNAIGFHEVVATRDHKKHFPLFSLEETKEVFDLYQSRFVEMKKSRFVSYVSIFHNFGQTAGASIAHPHSQIITSPLIDADIRSALENAESYFNSKKKCVYCEMNEWEKKSKERLVLENKSFIAVCPFASKSSFEVIISPKKHLPRFEEITEEEKWEPAEIFKRVMGKLYNCLKDPDYNFYLHTAPCDGGGHGYYHWHWTILPKTSTWAGFEKGMRMEISTIEPEKAAQFLRQAEDEMEC